MSSTERQLVLVVDDNEIGRYTKARILRQAGFEVLEATTGGDALSLIRERQPRLTILDVQLPDIDGWEVCRRIKADPATASVLVLQVSATYVNEADTVRALEGGADACLTEPIESPVLVATVRALLRARQAELALREALGREQAARETAEAANRSKDEFLATLSHELRSPLGTILTWVTLLRAGQLDERRRVHALEAIERNTRLQVRLIEDLLDVSRIISGKMVLDVALVGLAAVVDAAVESVRPAVEAKGIQLEASVDPMVGPVSGDPARLQQVLWNLLSNAVKFTPKGGTVHLRAEPAASSVRIVVADSGKGIAPDFLPHIFERFRQADSSSTRPETGLGLGLAIVRHLVELHGGTVEAASPGLDQGATFTVTLPLPAVRSAEVTSTARSRDRRVPAVVLGALGGVRVLVVDDERDAREAITAVLEQSGAEVRPATSVGEALRMLEGFVPDVVVSDIAMPGADGYTLIREVRTRGEDRGRAIPALALTGYASTEDGRRIVAAGFHAYLTKPIEATDLVAAVARLAGLQAAS